MPGVLLVGQGSKPEAPSSDYTPRQILHNTQQRINVRLQAGKLRRYGDQKEQIIHMDTHTHGYTQSAASDVPLLNEPMGSGRAQRPDALQKISAHYYTLISAAIESSSSKSLQWIKPSRCEAYPHFRLLHQKLDVQASPGRFVQCRICCGSQ